MVSRLPSLEQSMQKTHIWINEIMEQSGMVDKHDAYVKIKAAFHLLRDQLSVNESAQFASALPLFLKGVFYDQY